MARVSTLLFMSALVPISIGCGDAAPQARHPTTSNEAPGAPAASAAARAARPVAPVAPIPPIAPIASESSDFTREQYLHVSDGDDTPAVVAHRYGPAKLTEAQRWTALGEIGARYKQMVTDQASLTAFAAWLKTRKELEAAGTHERTVWGRFIDGRLLVFTSTPAAVAPATPTRLGARVTEPTMSARSAKELPASNAVIGIDTVGAYTVDNAAMVTRMTDAGHQGAAWDGSTHVTVPFLAQAVAGQGLLNWNSHGGSGVERDDHHEYVLQTATPVRDCAGNRLTFHGDLPAYVSGAHCSDAALEPYFTAGELAYTSATIWQNGRFADTELTDVWAYAINHRFVKNHFRLAKHAIVMLDACQGGTSEAAAMRGAFLGAGADVVMAWGDDVEPYTGVNTANYFWYLLLGAVSEPHFNESPLERPWDLEHTFAELQRRHQDVSHTADGTMALLRPSPRSAKAIVLASITYVEVDELKQKLTLHGDFGDAQPANAKVTVGGKDCSITSFAPDKVECDAGPAFNVGPVYFVADGRKSNAVPLTGWKISADYVVKFPPQMPGNFSQSWHIDAHFRADVHRHREQIHDAHGKNREPFSVMAAHDSTCTPAPTGTLSLGAAGNVKASAGAPITATFGPPSASGTCIVLGQLDPQAKTLALGLLAMGGMGEINVNALRPTVLPTPPATIMDEMKDTTVSSTTGRSMNAVTVEFDSSWAVIARRSPSKRIGAGGEIYLDVKATPAMPFTAPDEKTEE